MPLTVPLVLQEYPRVSPLTHPVQMLYLKRRHLLLLRRPPAVPWLLIPIIVYPMDPVFLPGPLPHILHKLPVLLPPLAHPYPSPSISMPPYMTLPPASIYHPPPTVPRQVRPYFFTPTLLPLATQFLIASTYTSPLVFHNTTTLLYNINPRYSPCPDETLAWPPLPPPFFTHHLHLFTNIVARTLDTGQCQRLPPKGDNTPAYNAAYRRPSLWSEGGPRRLRR
jgi:hypothetical protein